jgi:hypothetical protein
MWKLVLRAVRAASKNPAAQQWVKRRARRLIDLIRLRAEKRITGLQDAAGIEVGKR